MHRQITGRLIIATHNKGKLAEMGHLLGLHGVEAVSASELNLPEPEETGTTFAANARLNGVAVETASVLPECWDVLLAADVLYDASARALLREHASAGQFLRRAATRLP